VVAKLNRDVGAILGAADTREIFLKQGVASTPSTPEELAEWVRAELARWTPIIQGAGIKAD
jgi:tripartite-type tricarboxylate transporter receptor subunit TctC